MKPELEFYNDIQDLPLERFNAFNKYVMLDTELGSSIQDFDKIVVRIHEFINKEMTEDAVKELMNLRFVVNNVLNENNLKGLAFASLIKKVNGKAVEDYTEEKLRELLKELSDKGLTIGEVDSTVKEVKKK